MLTHTSLALLCRARDQLREAQDVPIPIATLAREAGLSTYQFIRLFNAVFGDTPHQYRIHARLERAKDLLAADECSVTDICMEVGFSSLGSFSDLFARRIGVAPSRYRRQVRSSIAIGGVALPRKPGCLTLMAAAFASPSSKAFRSPGS